jgi:UPF0755 protein
MSKYPALAILLFLLGVVVLSTLFGGLPGTPRPTTVFVLHSGWGTDEVIRALHIRGILTQSGLFKTLVQLAGYDSKLKAGVYDLEVPSAVLPLLIKLGRGGDRRNMIMIPEGLRVEETVEILAARLDCTGEALLRAGSNRRLLKSLGIEGSTCEGFLFPDTYDIELNVSPESVIARMVRRALAVFGEEASGAPGHVLHERNEVFTLASIVEAETRLAEEKPKVAAVYYNRLARGWKLQADPTVAYALGTRPARITERDLRLDSPYNTYLVPGLPPTPICSPGRESIRASLKPEAGFGALYFVATGDGGHVFSETLAEHLRAKHAYRKGSKR